MEDQKFSFQGVIQKLKEYLQNTKNLTLLKLVDRLSSLFAALVTDGLMIVFGFFILLFLSIGLGFYFGELFGSNALGFAALAGVYLLLVLILSVSKNNIEKSLINLSIKKFFKKWNEEDEN